jgi:hypothetical protein
MYAKFAGTCDKCQQAVNVGEEISWNRKRRGVVYHLSCAKPALGNEITRTEPPTERNMDGMSIPEIHEMFSGKSEDEKETVKDWLEMPVTPKQTPVNGDLASVIASAIQSHLQMPMQAIDADSVRAIVKDELKDIGVQPVTVHVFNAQTQTTEDMGVQHHLFPELLTILSTGLNVWLTGPAGSGKTTAAHNCAKALGLEFRFCGAQSNEYGLLGFTDANGRTVRTPFREAYEHGGVFLFDEVDASSASAVLAFNAALANGVCNFPDAIVERHEKFVCIAAANTFGLGATNDYVGRMKQDAAFIDRFVSLAWDIDEALETSLSGNATWAKRVQSVRAKVRAKGIKIVISPRASIFGAKLLASGMNQSRVEVLTLQKGMDATQWESVS